MKITKKTIKSGPEKTKNIKTKTNQQQQQNQKNKPKRIQIKEMIKTIAKTNQKQPKNKENQMKPKNHRNHKKLRELQSKKISNLIMMKEHQPIVKIILKKTQLKYKTKKQILMMNIITVMMNIITVMMNIIIALMIILMM